MSLKPILVDVSDLWQDTNGSQLKESVTSGTGTIQVYSIADFAVSKILLIGEFGQEGSEIIKTHAATAPTGTTVTLASNVVKSHPKDTPVYIIPYDQIEISHAATLTGNKSVLSTQTINPEHSEIRYDDSTQSTGFYFTRYKETVGNTFSAYSDGIPYNGYEPNTVGFVIYNVLDELGKELNEQLTYQMLINKINGCLRFAKGKLKRWSNNQEFDYSVGQLNRGEYKIALPISYYDKNSNKSCLAVRIGSGDKLIYKDKNEFNDIMRDVVHTKVQTQGEVNDTSLVLDSTDDLPESGSIDVFVSNELYTITYTANNKGTNTLSGIPASGTGSITVTLPVDSNVWYNTIESEVEYFTIFDGYIYFWGLINSTDAGKNVLMDFYTDIDSVDSDTDILTGARYDMVEYWLKWEIRNITENNGKRDMQDGDYQMFLTVLSDAVRRESSGQKWKMKPKINGISYGNNDELDFDRN